MKIYQSSKYRKDFRYLHFDNEPRVPKRQQVKDWQSCISIFVAYLAKTRGTSPDMATVFYTWAYGRFIKIQINLRRKKLHRMNQRSNFLGGSFSNTDNVRPPIQFRRESQPKHLKRWFILRNRPIHFHINRTSVIRTVKQNRWVFSASKSTSHFLPQSKVSWRSDPSSQANSSCCHRSDTWSQLELK